MSIRPNAIAPSGEFAMVQVPHFDEMMMIGSTRTILQPVQPDAGPHLGMPAMIICLRRR